MNTKSNSKFSDKLQKYLAQKKYTKYSDGVIYFRDNISMVEKGKTTMNNNNNQILANFMLDRKHEWEDAKTATFDFSSERSSGDEEDERSSGTCTLCTSDFSFCNQSYIADK